MITGLVAVTTELGVIKNGKSAATQKRAANGHKTSIDVITNNTSSNMNNSNSYNSYDNNVDEKE